MQPEILEYLSTQSVCALAVITPEGTTHAATMHFAYPDNMSIYLGTSRTSLKFKSLSESPVISASLVMGVEESSMTTLQIDGTLEVVSAEEYAQFREIYLGRFPEKKEKVESENFAPLKFVPKWWRFTDMKNKIVLVSQ